MKNTKATRFCRKWLRSIFLQKKKKKNEGEAPQYYVKNSHEAIVSPDVFDEVQSERARRASLLKETKLRRYSGASIFSTRILCGDCEGWYGPKTWHSGTRYEKVVFQCNHKYKNGTVCRSPNLTEQDIKRLFVEAMRLAEWDSEVWSRDVENVTAFRNEKIVFLLKNGLRIETYLK